MTEPVMNSREKRLFEDRDTETPALRSFSHDEATLAAAAIDMAAGHRGDQVFTLQEALDSLALLLDLPHPKKYLRPMHELLQRYISAGLMVDAHLAPIGGFPGPLERRGFRSVYIRSLMEWAIGANARAIGLPYVSHVFGDAVVRVHSNTERSGLASGLVVARDWIVTNAHVVRNATEVAVSWADSAPVAVQEVICASSALDIAVVRAPGFEPFPYPWFRAPQLTEPVAVLAYPLVPQIPSRPLLRFAGHVSTHEPITTFFGDSQFVVSAVMGPGASGGPIFSSDGYVVGLVVDHLEGQYIEQTGTRLISTFHAAIPGDTVLKEVRALHKDLEWVNTFGPEGGDVHAPLPGR